MATVLIGPTELFIDCKYDEHVKAWRWHCFRTGNYFELGRMIVYGRKS